MKVKLKRGSDTLLIALMLTLAGGFMDAYTYFCRGKVFANAETGNLIMIAVHISNGKFNLALRSFFPVVAFAIGIFISDVIGKKVGNGNIHWQKKILLIDCFILICVYFMPLGSWDNFANMCVAFVSALQMQSFRKCLGNPYVSTMCTGNLRSGTENLYKYIFEKNKQAGLNAGIYYIVITVFVIGALMGAFIIRAIGNLAALVLVLPLFTSAILIDEKS